MGFDHLDGHFLPIDHIDGLENPRVHSTAQFLLQGVVLNLFAHSIIFILSAMLQIVGKKEMHHRNKMESNLLYFGLLDGWVLHFQLFPSKTDEIHSALVVFGQPMHFAEHARAVFASVAQHTHLLRAS